MITMLNEYVVKKKNGECQPFVIERLHDAVEFSAADARGYRFDFESGMAHELMFSNNTHLSDDEWAVFDNAFANLVLTANLRKKVVCTKKIHDFVIKALDVAAPDVSKAYKEYHLGKKSYRENLDAAVEARDTAFFVGDLSNANMDSALASSRKALSADAFERSLNLQLLDRELREAHEIGTLYINDLSALSTYPFNCCLFRAGELLEKGYSLNGVDVPAPKSLAEAFTRLAEIILIAASQQFGGLTIPRVDEILAPYAAMTFKDVFQRFVELGIEEDLAITLAEKEVEQTSLSGFNSLEFALNTVGSSRGDYPFTTFTGGHALGWAARLWDACLKVRRERNRPVLFPKLVFLYDENLHAEGKDLNWLYETALFTSGVCMYPDYLSLTGEGYVPEMYKKYGAIISPMGCRAFLSPWYEKGGMHPADEDDRPVFEGRFNIGVVSLNLPMIWGIAQKKGVDFYAYLDYHLELIRKFFKKRYHDLGKLKAAINPLAFCFGGLYGGNLKPTDNIAPVLASATASFGITALNELQQFYNQKSLVEDGAFALEVMEYINEKVNQFKMQDGRLYAIYGTPAESLSGKQARQLRECFGVIPGVSDRDYVSNSFHCHVTEHISPIQKQDYEKRFWNLLNGGKIQYCKYPLAYNHDAIKTLVDRAMGFGFYEGVNMDLSFCGTCGQRFETESPDGTCPHCGSANIYSVNRMNGYLAYTRVGSSDAEHDSTHVSRFNPAKRAEIFERVSM